MSYMVMHTPTDGTAQYSHFDDQESAIAFIEGQRNAGSDEARLFETREIALEVTSYIKVVVADTTPTAPVVPLPTVEAPVPQPIVPLAADVIEPAPVAAPVADEVAYVEAVMASPIDAFAAEGNGLGELGLAEPVEVPPAPTEGRRGLFGR